MKAIFHPAFMRSYCSDPAASEGRIKSIINAISNSVEFIKAIPAAYEDIAACHSKQHIEAVEKMGLYDISALAAGGAIQAATTGLSEPCFAVIRPPGHHASQDSSWGFCYFNNMAIALTKLKQEKKIKKVFVLDIDLHFGDGTVNILGKLEYFNILNPPSFHDPNQYLKYIDDNLPNETNIIGISAGFDGHQYDWGGLLPTCAYKEIGYMVREKSRQIGCAFFAILEGGYNNRILGANVLALIEGMEGK